MCPLPQAVDDDSADAEVVNTSRSIKFSPDSFPISIQKLGVIAPSFTSVLGVYIKVEMV
jgi:hypothetical protein